MECGREHTELLVRVTTVIILGSLNRSSVTLDGDLALAGAALVVVVDSVAGGDV